MNREDKLPEKLIQLDSVRIERGQKKRCSCREARYLIDDDNRFVHCAICGAIVEPYEALLKLSRQSDRMNRQQKAMFEQRKEIDNYKPHLVVFKELESKYRSQMYSMVPMCPRCGKPFDFKEIISWCRREFLAAIKKTESKEEQNE